MALPAEYLLEQVASGFTSPTGVAFDRAGTPFVTEAGASRNGEGSSAARLVRVSPGGQLVTVAMGDNDGPRNGITFADGAFFVAAGGESGGGRILRVTPGGHVHPIRQRCRARATTT